MFDAKTSPARAQAAKAFNEWMRRYIEEPERFEAEFRSVRAFEAAESKGEEPDYGTTCVQYLEELIDQLDASDALAKANAEVHE